MKQGEPATVCTGCPMPIFKQGYSSPLKLNDMFFRADHFRPPLNPTNSLFVGQNASGKSLGRPEYGEAWLKTFEAFVQSHLSDSKLDIPFLARHFFISESTLLRTLKRLTGNTAVQYLKTARLEKAHQLLRTGEVNQVGKVASAVGYKDPRSFARIFRERYGKLPSEYLQDRHE